MYKKWCGESCECCQHPCVYDEMLYCSPDCENLGENGEMNSPECKTCDAYIAYQEDLKRKNNK